MLYDQIAKSSSTVNVNSYTGSVDASVNRVFISNGIVHLSLKVATTGSTKYPSSTTLFTIPEGYRPSTDINVPAVIKVGDASIIYFVSINTSGQIKQNLSANAVDILIDTSYIV